jgi:hypothetical protein
MKEYIKQHLSRENINQIEVNLNESFIEAQVEQNEQMVNKKAKTIVNNIRINTKDCCNHRMSCKGLQSSQKVKQYFDRKFTNREKVFICKWNRCQYKTKTTQGIAVHVNLTRIKKLEFKCDQKYSEIQSL